ncbi:SDR family NAD(P)-dependent oxidoreductase [Paraburkholderia sp. DHOC27]|uniref:SDR family NAD(P)-dependent oxidoreductase n=1 Tax=Paraburkholderia sp. DHOC27 TaxID=2303330 RepID=UPI000E3DAA70|nr:SDR family NAD(P)-dependent oxidoreductase [Paraburkholderia sp. DHOC27]RFU48459.1 SDR family NAD(P)-dependent oxidoreductase [Paraburkholderia sp. DHOC27]
MATIPYKTALIIGAGPGISASLTRLLTRSGLRVALAARDVGKLETLASETGAHTFAADAADPQAVASLFEQVDQKIGEPDLVIYNASARAHGSITEIDPEAFRHSLSISAFGGFLAAQQAALRMIPQGRGAILFTGATASVKGFALSAAFATGKFGLRGLAQSVARELGPKGIHVAHFIIDGAVQSERRRNQPDEPDSLLSPDAIAQTYFDVLSQHRSAWTHEIDLRPWVEKF